MLIDKWRSLQINYTLVFALTERQRMARSAHKMVKYTLNIL